MPLLRPGDEFPELTLAVPGGQAIPVPGSLAGEFGVMLFNRGAWVPLLHRPAARVPAGQRLPAALVNAVARILNLS
jgi:hypothetical protein